MKPLEQPPRETIIHSTPGEVRSRLRDLGLSTGDVTRTAEAWARAEAAAPVFGPRNAPGFLGWTAGTAIFREERCLAGCRRLDPKGAPLSLDPERLLLFSITSADGATGLKLGHRHPVTKNPKGVITVEAVLRNAHQLEFSVDANGKLAIPQPPSRKRTREQKPTRSAQKQSPTTWLVLVHFNAKLGILQAEVSLPRGVVGRKICSWSERILVPVGDGKFPPLRRLSDIDEKPAEAIDVPVSWR